ncbi:hypothetical protein V6N12_024713 [Hibiscus sabdariffa]|uniref:WAT1-related protein n=1 Tax=Hibiscus sabdariffa TaxID=183260 RepID=A0ABR2BF11_9ROSI
MEVVDVRSHRGMAKFLGTLISLLGVTVITLYKGPALQNMWGTPIHMKRLSIHDIYHEEKSSTAVAYNVD